ncbi:MAG: DUF5996 family protein [Inquilinaceae bacterium]
MSLPTADTFPALPYDDWVDTKETLHLFLQIIGKIRLKAHPKLNHWWHVSLYPSPRGLTTALIPYKGRNFEILFDMIDHAVIVSTDDGATDRFSVPGRSVAEFHKALFAILRRFDLDVTILARPYENKSTIPFAEDRTHTAYDPEAANRYWHIIANIAAVMETFRGRFIGKSTPVHLFWHSFDLALTRFSGRAAPPLEGGTQSDREAYSHEVISVGFWPGDDDFREPAFYAYAAPEPKGLKKTVLVPKGAAWTDRNGSALAVYRYDDMRRERDPTAALLAFLTNSYEAAARCAKWDLTAFENRFVA